MEAVLAKSPREASPCGEWGGLQGTWSLNGGGQDPPGTSQVGTPALSTALLLPVAASSVKL